MKDRVLLQDHYPRREVGSGLGYCLEQEDGAHKLAVVDKMLVLYHTVDLIGQLQPINKLIVDGLVESPEYKIDRNRYYDISR